MTTEQAQALPVHSHQCMCWLHPDQIATLRNCSKHNVIRSNYTADKPNRYGEYQVHYKSLDCVVRLGLVMRVGRYYKLTDAGMLRLGL